MQLKEYSQPSFLEDILQNGVISEKHRHKEVLLLTTPDCTPELAQKMLRHIQQYGMYWFQNKTQVERVESRRQVWISHTEPSQTLVVKKKALHRSQQNLKSSFFTQSVIHEIRTSYLLEACLQQMELPSILEYEGQELQLLYRAQKPLAALLNTADPQERFTIFEYIPGESVRDEVVENGGWNATDEKQRKFFAALQGVLNTIANQVIESGLEPWDLGVHQLIYRFDWERKHLHLGILDTEEYNISSLYGAYWPETFVKFGLHPSILFV